MNGETSNPRDDELVANLGWVQRLALSLARNRDAADDLAQEVARVWLEKRPAHADGPRGWLASVARKLALDRARSESSRRLREQRAARPEGESWEVVERGARQRRVVEAAMQLAEPYRSTILYRYLDGLETREVAERMGVSEAAVRKRVERGLALLRERLDREFGSRTNAWAAALLEPGLRNVVLKGAGIMSVKWIAAAGALVLLAGAAWYVRGGLGSGAAVEVGGQGVVVPPEVVAAREKTSAAPEETLESADSSARSNPVVAPAPASSEPRLAGFVFVDDEHRAPEDLRITRKADDSRAQAAASVDVAHASWSLEPLGGAPGVLWVTSSTTVPAQIPVPPELWRKGGAFDLHLSTGRSLTLTFLDRATKRPLADLEFQLSRSVEIARSAGRVTTDGNQSTHRTDAEGRARLSGVPLTGYISVTVDFAPRERDILMRDGASSRVQIQRNPDWSTWLKKEMPGDLAETVLVDAPLGEACAEGQVPGWAVSKAGGAENVQVIARETTNETPQARGMEFRLAQDARGHFELCANAPSTLAVWLERTSSRERLSAETALEFRQAGAQDPISFRELEGKKVTLRFIHVPARGELQTWAAGKDSKGSPASAQCAGADFSREVTLAEGEQIRVSLRLEQGKSGWTRLLDPGEEREITVDLGGSERRVRLESGEIDLAGHDGAILLLRVENGEAQLEQSIVVLCKEGRGDAPVLVPNGRWLFRYDDKDQAGVWGVIDVATATQSGEELVLRPRLRLAPIAEFEAGLRIDEVEGVSLEKLPEKFRLLNAKSGAAAIAVPRDAKFGTLEGK